MFSACLKESFYDCPESIRVYFNFDNRSGEDQSKHIDRMNLYVFDRYGFFLYEYRDDAVEFSSDYYIDCSNLYPGSFRFIAWAGKDEDSYATQPGTFVRYKTTYKEAFLMLNQMDDLITDVIHPLFYSAIPATVTKTREQYFEMPLEIMTNTINIHTIGLPDDNNEYAFEIGDINSSYMFDGSLNLSNDLKTSESFKYVSPCDKDEKSQLYSTINILRLSINRYSPQLQIYDQTTGRSLYPANEGQTSNLIDLIRRANPNNDFEKTHTYDIVLNFGETDPTNPDDNGLIITINGWEIREQDNNLYD